MLLLLTVCSEFYALYTSRAFASVCFFPLEGASNDDLNNNDNDKNASGDTKGGGELPPNGSKRKPLATTFPGARSASARLAPSTSRQTTRPPSPGRHHEGDWVGGTVIAAGGGGGAARGTDGGSGGNAAEVVDWGVGGGSEVGAEGGTDVDDGSDGGGSARERHNSTGLADRAETAGRGRPRIELPAMVRRKNQDFMLVGAIRTIFLLFVFRDNMP